MSRLIKLTFGFLLLGLGLLQAEPARATSIVVSGNGTDSVNTTNVSVVQQTQITQTNTANISNTIDAASATGSNSAANNSGGNVSISTGNAQTGVTVGTQANRNSAQSNLEGCCTESNQSQTSVAVKISDNGVDSHNSVELNLSRVAVVSVDNYTQLRNDVNAQAKTGGNSANGNTGGNVQISTGNATTSVNIGNRVNDNQTVVSCCGVGGTTPTPTPGPGGGGTTDGGNTTSTPPTVIALAPPSQSGQVLGVGGGLPITGTNDLLWNLLIAGLLLALGSYVRRLGATPVATRKVRRI